MQKNKPDILIIGGGLSALSIAYFLKDYDIKIIEARERLGGRIFTQYDKGEAPVEKGATWFGQNHTELTKLLNELKIGVFEQTFGPRAIYEPISTSPAQLVALPPNSEPSFRIRGGSSVLINELAKYIKEDQINTDEIVTQIEEEEKGLIVHTNKNSYKADIVISTLPPNLFASTIQVSSGLPTSFLTIAQQTHTWMGESIKIALRFKSPFWRTEHSSATLFSNVGPVTELYDHSNYEDNSFALKGFLNRSYFPLSKEQRLDLVLKQLGKYYGEAIKDFSGYKELVWRTEPFTFAEYSQHVLPHQNNGHTVYQQTYLNDKLYLAGAETASEFSGYMEGAIRRAKEISEQITKKHSS